MNRNNQMRMVMSQYHNKHLKPQWTLVANEMKVSEYYFSKWLTGHYDASEDFLDKAERFLNVYDFENER